MEMLQIVHQCIREAMVKFAALGFTAADIKGPRCMMMMTTNLIVTPNVLFSFIMTCKSCHASSSSSSSSSSSFSGLGITNQRETTIAWDKSTGLPLYEAIGWIYCRALYLCYFNLCNIIIIFVLLMSTQSSFLLQCGRTPARRRWRTSSHPPPVASCLMHCSLSRM